MFVSKWDLKRYKSLYKTHLKLFYHFLFLEVAAAIFVTVVANMFIGSFQFMLGQLGTKNSRWPLEDILNTGI